MRRGLNILVLSAGLSLCGCSGPDMETLAVESVNNGPWTLTADQSGITYLTVKNNSVAEINTFRSIDGRVSVDGAAEFTVVLDTVDTNNEIRDPRMRQHLFETDKYPYAKITANVDMAKFQDLAIGDRHTHLLSANIDLHGSSENRDIYVMVTRLGANKALIENKAPVLLNISDFGLEEGLQKLRDLAGLENITPVVPVTFSLVFER